MIESSYRCDRCGEKADEGEFEKRWIGLCYLRSSAEDLHLCSTCADAFHVWLEMLEEKP